MKNDFFKGHVWCKPCLSSCCAWVMSRWVKWQDALKLTFVWRSLGIWCFGSSELNVPQELALEMDLPWCSVAAVFKIYLQWQQFLFQVFLVGWLVLQLCSWSFPLSAKAGIVQSVLSPLKNNWNAEKWNWKSCSSSCANICTFDLVKLFRIVAQTLQWRLDGPRFVGCGVGKWIAGKKIK